MNQYRVWIEFPIDVDAVHRNDAELKALIRLGSKLSKAEMKAVRIKSILFKEGQFRKGQPWQPAKAEGSGE